MKKLLCMCLAAMLLLATAVPTFASEKDSVALEKAIKTTRSIIDIPVEATEFEYNSWEDQEFGTIWNLSWSDAKRELSYSVSILESGTILNYYSYRNMETMGMGNVSREQGQAAAETFLKKVLPSSVTEYKLMDSGAYDATLSYNYCVYKNNIPANYASFSVEVDRFSGKVSSYYGQGMALSVKDSFPAATNVIGTEKAQEAFLAAKGVSLTYQAYYDWEKKELTIFPAYTLNTASRYIDAVTGKVAKRYDSAAPGYGAGGRAMADNAKSEAASQNLTPGEQQAVDNVAGVITKEEAVKSALSKAPQKPADAKPTYAGLMKSFEANRYFWNISFKDMGVSIDAKSGQLLSFYTNTETSSQTGTISVEIAKEKGVAFLQTVAKEQLAQSAYSEASSYIDLPEASKTTNYREPYTFVYERQVNGISFPGNSISVSVHPATGKITGYSLGWFDQAEFPSIEGVMDSAKAFSAFAQDSEFTLFYIKSAEKKAALVYGFLDQPGYMIHPTNGQRIGYDGKPYKDREDVQSYDDIAGTWYEDTVMKLLDGGYYLTGASFQGGKQISQEEFLRFLYAPVQSYYDQEAFYDMMVQNKVIKRNEIAPGNTLTRQGAVKLTIRYLGLDKAAADGSIYKTMYKDAIAPEYTGYAALAKALGIMKGDAAGNFNGSKNLTRAEAAVVIWNTLENR